MTNPFMSIRRAMKSRAEVYSLEEKQKLFNEYRDSIGLKADVKSDAFTQLLNDRVFNYHGFKDTLGPGALKVYDQLSKDNDNTKVVRSQIEEALKSPIITETVNGENFTYEQFARAKIDYEDSISALNELIKKIPEKYKVADLIGVMSGIQDDALKAITEQQTHETQKMDVLFKDVSFNTHFKNALGYPEKDCEEIKQNMMADLTAAHEKQLAAFKESATTSLNTLHQASAKQNTEFLFLANLNKNNDLMREKMRLLAAEKAKTAGVQQNIQAEVGIDEKRITISGLTINDITVIENTTGKNITRNAEGGYDLEFGRYILNPLYYSSPKNNVEMDIRTVVEATKASGAKGIVMNVQFSNPELAITRAKQCYKACIESGYDPKDIKMNVNGKLMKPEEIYSTEGHKLQALHGKSAKIIKKLEDIASSPSNAPARNVAAAKAEMVQLRERARAQVAPVAEVDGKPPLPSASLNGSAA